MKKTPALIAAFLMTAVVGFFMLVIGGNALFSVPSVAASSGSAVEPTSDQTAQLQARIAEYQAREEQWQQRLDQAQGQISQLTAELQQSQGQLSQVNGELQQYQQLVSSLQQMGVISIDQNGQVLVSRGGREFDRDDD
jgi:peptidoglycan hydrolase CwlO-like protein